jgi:hypothetical protein
MKDHKKIRYCWDRDIRIYPVPVPYSNGNQNPKCKIEIDYQGKIRQGDTIYKQDRTMYNKIKELYLAYYEKIS